MLAERLGEAWRARRASTPVDAGLRFADEGLVLGAGTLLARAEADGADRRIIRLEGREARLAALLSAAHLRAPSLQTVNHIRKAVERWGEGEAGLAHVHLALSGLGPLKDPDLAAQRLFLADGLMDAGIEPEAILKGLGLDPSTLEALAKDFRTQPRVPAGSGRTSGEWTTAGGAGAAAPADLEPAPQDGPAIAEPAGGTNAAATSNSNDSLVRPLAASDFGTDASAAVSPVAGSAEWLSALSSARLIALAAAIAPAAVGGIALNLILVPNASLRHDGAIPGKPPIHYLWHDDGRVLTLLSRSADGAVHAVVGVLGADDYFRDDKGRVIGRRLPNGTVLILLTALTAVKAAEKAEPDFCPAPGRDKPGRNNALDRDFEDYVKEFDNPGNPTPRGYGYQLPNPKAGGKLVFLDDCIHRSGDVVDAKRGYDGMINNPKKVFLMKGPIGDQWLGDSARQLDASVGRELIWIFSNQVAAGYAQKLFDRADDGRERIHLVVLPWIPGQTWN